MLVEKLQLTHFRNFRSLEFKLDSKINVFIGANGQGKTSILESIGVLASLRSFRDAKPSDWIQTGQNASEIYATVIPSLDQIHWRNKIGLNLSRDSEEGIVRKKIFWNEKILKSSAQYLKKKFGAKEFGFHAICFNPSDHDLIRGEPSGRRQYLDRLLSAENPEYFDRLLLYQKILEQRNQALKDTTNRFSTLIPEFTEPLIGEGAFLTFSRLLWISKFSEKMQKIALKIAPKQSELSLFYSIKWLEKKTPFLNKNNSLDNIHFTGHSYLPSIQDLMGLMKTRLNQVQLDEQRLGSTLVGPHRDDWFIQLNEKTLRGRGSQGEVRTALLALKLTEIESFRETTNHRPILLLDDFSSELDFDRRQYLMQFLEETDLQVLISSTESIGLPGKMFFLEDGMLK